MTLIMHKQQFIKSYNNHGTFTRVPDTNNVKIPNPKTHIGIQIDTKLKYKIIEQVLK